MTNNLSRNQNSPIDLVDRVLFCVIDTLNKRGEHTAPSRVRQNIRVFLEDVSKKFDKYVPQTSVGLDIGAGYGILSDVLEPRRIYNLDILPPKDGHQPQIRGRAERLPFADEQFDFACFFYSLPHFSDPVKAFQEADRVIRKGGYIISIMEFLRYPGQGKFIMLNEISMNGIIYGRLDEPGDGHNYFRKSEFERLIDELNLQRILIHNFLPTRWFDVAFKSSKSLYILQKK